MLTKTPQYSDYDYTLTADQVGVVHVGVGSFHRSHQAAYLDNLLALTNHKKWGVIGVNLRAEDSNVVNKINARNGRYFLKSMANTGHTDWRQICSIHHVIDASKNAEDAFDILCRDNIKLLTMTVTESGYYTDDNNQLDLTHPLIKEEIHSNTAKGSIFGYLREALSRRMASINAPITIMCCDNLRHNSTMLKKWFYTYLHQSKRDDLCHWLNSNASFPCSVVDRITPYATQDLYDETHHLFAVNDASVIAEDFTQWVIEDNFANDKPALHDVGVKFTHDVTPYEETKIRILNGGHSCLAYLGALKNYTYFHEVMHDKELLEFFNAYQLHEVIPALQHDFAEQGYQEDTDCDLHQYLHITKKRFTNHAIGDTIARIATDGASKMLLFILPTTLCSLKNGKDASFSATIIASWYVFLQQYHQHNIPFTYHDSRWDYLAKNTIKNGHLDIDIFLNDPYIWSNIPKDYPAFLSLVKKHIKTVTKMIER